MTQCEGRTRKGQQCKREARPGSPFCSIHQDQESRPRSKHVEEWDTDSIVKAAIGVGLVVAIFLLRFRR